ncbi:E2F-associated phosphoprotein [Camelus dromedarius]|uniref:E2F-associated phosphoprotein n=1 Tax=Camelus dromedarius TaxID=9838 RepID=A0A5N4E207_CAMDR|nr:E2F-associated phosphoprotein [Camelus dromedarius]
MNRFQDDYDPYAVEEPSDEEPALSSSEDEVDVLLHGTPDQKRKLIRECLTGERSSSGNGKIGMAPTKFYDDIYFDSDSEDEDKATQVTKRKKKKQHRIPTNDELLYDPEKDNRDQAWVDAQRRGHESYKTQYRAMFVMNCSVNKEEILRYKTPENRKKRRGHKKMKSNQDAAEQAETDMEEIYHPVMCTECSTEVAVYDKDEVFHFFNVLASHS